MKLLFKGFLYFVLFSLVCNLIIAVIQSKLIFILLFVAITFLSYKIYKKRKKIKMAKENNLLHEKELQTLRDEFGHYIHNYINAYTKNWGTWPEDLAIPEEDISALQLIFKNDFHKDIYWGAINILVKEEIKQQQQTKFNTSFLKIFYNKYEQLDLSNAIYMYCSLFGTNKNYLQSFHVFLCNNCLNNDINLLINLISKTSTLQGLERHVEDIKYAINTNTALNRRATILDTDKMDGIEFEKFLGKLFKRMGYLITLTKASGDQGADLLLEKNGHKIVVQAKCYSDKVSNSAVQEAFAAKTYYNCHAAIVATNNYFTKSARNLAESNKVDLFDRDRLTKLLESYPIIL